MGSLYLVSLLTVFVHTQLNILGRFIYLDSLQCITQKGTTHRLEGEAKSNRKGVSTETERKFLTFSWYLLNVGWKRVMDKVDQAVQSSVAKQVIKYPSHLVFLLQQVWITHLLCSNLKQFDRILKEMTSKWLWNPYLFRWILSCLMPSEGEEADVLKEGQAHDEDDPRFKVDDELKPLLDEIRDFIER
jgi:peroxin-3